MNLDNIGTECDDTSDLVVKTQPQTAGIIHSSPERADSSSVQSGCENLGAF